MTDTIDIVTKYVVRRDVSLTFLNQGGFFFDDNPDSDPSFTNRGSVLVTNDSSGEGGIYGVYAQHSFVHNDAGASFSVISTTTAMAVGCATNFEGPAVANAGTWTVSSLGAALGAEVWLGSTFDNSGTFTVSGGLGAVGVHSQYGVAFSNEGLFQVDGGQGQAIGVQLKDSSISFVNTGTLAVTDQTSDFDAIAVAVGHYEDVVTLVNDGVISSPDYAIKEVQAVIPSQHSPDVIINRGSIFGAIALGLGDDTVDNTGLIRGEIDLGKDDDLYDGAKGRLVGAVRGGAGDDMLIGGRHDDVLIGDRDKAAAKDGADTLVGGGGDALTGGGGHDLFVYRTISDSIAGRSDLILDLSDEDRIDLSQIDADSAKAGDQAFHLVGALHGHAGEAALVYDAVADQTRLELDVDGDGAADSVILISGEHSGFTGFIL